MIEFVTLFLGGLLTGPRPVEIMAEDSVTAIEVRLDGEVVQRLNRPPWTLEVDLGPDLSPHILDAVGFDTDDREIARVRQWINMSPQGAQSSLMIDGATQGQGAVARVSWQSLAQVNEPRRVEVQFDGQPLTVADPRTIPLPDFDPEQTHHLSVRLQFTDVLFSEAEAVFGGAYGSEISTEISAVPIRYAKGSKPRSADAVRGWFKIDGEVQRIHALEKGLADIVVVRDGATEVRIAELASQAAQLETDIHLKKHHRLSFISPCPEIQRRDRFRQLVYPQTRRYSSQDGTFLKMLDWILPQDCPVEMQQIADAVAVAGLSASGDGRRRIVILLIDGEPRDRSFYSPAQVIGYLRELRVPLVVWSLDPSGGLDTRWGEVTNVRKLGRFGKAFNLVEKELEHQMIVWLEGLHLPQAVELRPGIEGITLVD
jgi:hypothetical protein